MSFVVRHKSTGCYLRGQDDWTPQEEAALQFPTGLKLVDYVEHGGVHEKAEVVEIVVRSGPADNIAFQ
ncbi:MAG TPA: hypothetical protein VK633_07370 [Verrucomicrobiae bacterium]|nr:hypothetical protein [Verrucomicrobiae bacterium]